MYWCFPCGDRDELLADLTAAKESLDASRPTAVNLSWVRTVSLYIRRVSFLLLYVFLAQATGRLLEFVQAMVGL